MIAIGALSRRTGVNIETVRYYERISLMPKARRTDSGRRLYSEDNVRQLSFIRHARELGFGIESIRTLLKLRELPEASCEDINRIAQVQLAAVEGRIARLLGLRGELRRMINACANGKVANCRIIEVLAEPISLPAEDATNDRLAS